MNCNHRPSNPLAFYLHETHHRIEKAHRVLDTVQGACNLQIQTLRFTADQVLMVDNPGAQEKRMSELLLACAQVYTRLVELATVCRKRLKDADWNNAQAGLHSHVPSRASLN